MRPIIRETDVRAAEGAKRETAPRPKTEEELRQGLRKFLERYRDAFERLGKY